MRRCCLIILLGLLIATTPGFTEPPQNVPKWEIPPGVELPPDFPIDEFEIDPFEILRPEEVPEHMRPQAELRGAQVPYAARAHSLLEMLGSVGVQFEGDRMKPPLETMLVNLGLDPSSDAAAELLTLAMDFSVAYRQSVRSRFERPIMSLEKQHEMEEETYRQAGSVFGEWLSGREVDGWAITPLIERLLNHPGRMLSMFSTDESQEEFEQDVADYEKAFREGVRDELGWVPRRFQ